MTIQDQFDHQDEVRLNHQFDLVVTSELVINLISF